MTDITIPTILCIALLVIASLVLAFAVVALIAWVAGSPFHVLQHIDYMRLKISEADLARANATLGGVAGFRAVQNDRTHEVIGYLRQDYLWMPEKATRQNQTDWDAFIASRGGTANLAAPAPDPDAELSEWRKRHIG